MKRSYANNMDADQKKSILQDMMELYKDNYSSKTQKNFLNEIKE